MGIRRSCLDRAVTEVLETRRLMAASPAGVYDFGGAKAARVTDADGTVAKFSMPAGKGTVTVADDGSWHVALSKSSAAATLTIASAGGNRRVAVADIVAGSALGTLDAGRAGLTGKLALTNVRTVWLGKVADLSVTSAGPLSSVRADSWADNDGTADTLTAPSVGTLNVARNFAAGLSLSSNKMALSAASVGGVVRGTWAVAGSAGTLRFHAVRSPDLSIAKGVTSLTVDDSLTVAPVKSATGGVIHIGGKGNVSAGRGTDKFRVAKNTTLYTSTSATYTWSELYQYTALGRRWKYTLNNRPAVASIAPSTGHSGGHELYNLDSRGATGHQAEYYYVDSQGRGYLSLLYQQTDSNFNFAKLAISPPVYRPGVITRSSSAASGSASDGGLTAHLKGTANFSTVMIGHELVKTPAGTFLAVKLSSTLAGNFTGSVSNGVESIGVKVSLSETHTDYAVPGLGLVKYDADSTFKASAAGESETDHVSDHAVLTAAAV